MIPRPGCLWPQWRGHATQPQYFFLCLFDAIRQLRSCCTRNGSGRESDKQLGVPCHTLPVAPLRRRWGQAMAVFSLFGTADGRRKMKGIPTNYGSCKQYDRRPLRSPSLSGFTKLGQCLVVAIMSESTVSIYCQAVLVIRLATATNSGSQRFRTLARSDRWFCWH